MSQPEQKTVVLVADDEPSTLALVAAHVRSKGYVVHEASDGDQAWQLAHEHLPDLVILDVMMPGMSGWEVCRKIREAVSLAHTGVIMLTGIGEHLNEMTSPLYGADAYVDKPFDFARLDELIAQTLAGRREGAMGRPDPEVTVRRSSRPPPGNGMTGPQLPAVAKVKRRAAKLPANLLAVDEEGTFPALPAPPRKPRIDGAEIVEALTLKKAKAGAKALPPKAAKTRAEPKPAVGAKAAKPKAPAGPAKAATTTVAAKTAPAAAKGGKAAKAAAKKPAAKAAAKPAPKAAAKPAPRAAAKPAAKAAAKPAAKAAAKPAPKAAAKPAPKAAAKPAPKAAAKPAPKAAAKPAPKAAAKPAPKAAAKPAPKAAAKPAPKAAAKPAPKAAAKPAAKAAPKASGKAAHKGGAATV